MNLWLRLLWLMLFRQRQRVGLLETTTVRLRVWLTDLDLYRHVNNGRYLTLADIGRRDWFLRNGTMQRAARHGALPVMGDAIAKFRRELRLFQSFDIHSRLLGWDRRWIFLEHRFVRGGRVVGVVGIRALFKGRGGTLDPGELIGELGELGGIAASPALPEWLLHWNRANEALSAALRAEEAG
jgi:acyl-CoA thioesterase FadM